jgi:PAS domain S-box-containing protein/diguanylate cyclase (GGDEF)-like protein
LARQSADPAGRAIARERYESGKHMKRDMEQPLRLLLLEDNDDDARMVQRELARSRIRAETTWVTTREHFEAQLETCPDAIISDFRLPGWDGGQALQLVRGRGLDVPFILVSGTIDEDIAVDAIRHGADDYLLKDRLSRLGPALSQALERKRLRDLSRQRSKELRERDAGLRQAQRIANLAYAVTLSDSSLESWSETLPVLIGLEPDRMPKSVREWLTLLHPDDQAKFRDSGIESGKRGTRFDIEYRLRRGDGAWIHLRHVVEPLQDQNDAAGRKRWFNMVQDVTAQKRSEDELRSAARLLDNIVENIPTAVQLKSVADDHRVVLWNKAAEKMYGVPRREAIGRNVHDLWPEADADRFHAADLELIASGGSQDFPERPAQTRDRGEIRVHMRKVALFDGEGKPTHLLVIADDITEQLAGQARLRASEERFRSLSELSTDWFWEQDEELRFVEFSGGEGIGGWGKDQSSARGLRRWELPSIEPVSGSWDEHRALLDARKPFRDFEYKRLIGDGTVRYVAASGQPVFDACGTFRGYRGVATDITRRKRTELELQRFRAAMDISDDAVVLIDRASMRYIDVNQTACAMTGYSRQELLGMTPMELFGADRATLERDYDAIIAGSGGSLLTSEGVYRHKDGSMIPIETRRRAMQADGRWIIVGNARDISERKRAEHELQRFRMAMDVSPDSIYLTDPVAMRFVYMNNSACARVGYPRDRLLQMGPQDVLPGGRDDIRREYEEVTAAGDGGLRQERPYSRQDGSTGWTELHRRALDTDSGPLIVTIGRDITDRKQADDRIRRLNRVYGMLSGINALIVRVRDRNELFHEACRLAVEHGGFRLAWIGRVETGSSCVKTVAWKGDSAFAQYDRPLAAGNTAPRTGLTAIAVSARRPSVCNDIAAESDRLLHGKEALAHGYRSMVVLPLLVGGSVYGALSLYSGEKGFFDEEEMKLLTELAGDISFALDHIEKREQIDHLAFYDQLTGLANRPLFLERAGQSLHSARQTGGKCALALLDIERLRTVNESLGRQAGDALIKLVAERLRSAAGSTSVSRIGADHFALMLDAVRGPSQAGRLVNKVLHECFGKPFCIDGTDLHTSARAGVALFPEHAGSADALLAQAESALRKAKQMGERMVFVTAELTKKSAGQLTLENQLRQALARNEFVLHYQPKVDLQNRRIVGMEALIRWQSPELGLVPPGRFIPIMEETGLILDVGNWALQTAAAQHAQWLKEGLQPPRIAVNVSPIQLRRREFVATVESALRKGSAASIDLEITESLVMEDIQGNIGKLNAIRALGVGVAIDDFGTGYSSLAYLAKLPVQTLKIDRSFIIAMLDDPDTMTLVSTIISLAHSMRLTVVAEGVEREEQAKLLTLLRCDEMQGYLFSKPLPLREMKELLVAESSRDMCAVPLRAA